MATITEKAFLYSLQPRPALNKFWTSKTAEGLSKECDAAYAHPLSGGDPWYTSAAALETFKDLKGVITPHGASCDGFPVHTHAVAALAAHLPQRPHVVHGELITFVILGRDHKMRPTFVSERDWETPLGLVRNNCEVTRRIADLAKLPVEVQPYKV